MKLPLLNTAVILAHLAVPLVVTAQISDFSNFAESGNMLNTTGSNTRDQNFATFGTQITVSSASGSGAGQEVFGTNEFPSFLTDGYRLEVGLTAYTSSGGGNERAGLVVASSIPAPSSTDTRSEADYFYWVYRGGNLQAGMFTNGGIEEEASFAATGLAIGTDIIGLYMQRDAGSWNLGYIDENGLDVFLQSRSSVNGEIITTDGNVVGLYSDMRNAGSSVVFTDLSYVPEPSGYAMITSIAALAVIGIRRCRRVI